MRVPIKNLRLGVYSGTAVLLAILAWTLYGPMTRAWECTERYGSVPEWSASWVETLDDATVLRLEEGPRTGEHCTVPQRIEDVRDGERFAVVYLERTPERCELVETVSYARVVLWSLAVVMGCLVLLVVAGAIAIERALVRPARPQRSLQTATDTVACPACGAKMTEGVLVLTSGLHWRGTDEPVGLTPLFQGLPGTVAWRARPLLHAFQCERCEVVTAQYGAPDPA